MPHGELPLKTTAGDLLDSLASSPTPMWPGLLGAFAAVGLPQTLRGIADEPAWADRVASMSYRHGNGFLKVCLERRHGIALRLHIAAGAAEDNVHDHRWAFASHVVTGELENVIYKDARAHEAGEALRELTYIRAQGRHSTTANGTAHVCEVLRSRVGAGHGYWQDAELLHRIRWKGGTITLVATEPPGRATCRLLSRLGEPAARGPAIEPPELCGVLRACLANLEVSR